MQFRKTRILRIKLLLTSKTGVFPGEYSICTSSQSAIKLQLQLKKIFTR